MPAGRPSDYEERFCQVAEDTLAKGYSLAVLAGECDVSRETVDNWTKAHPEFLDAVKRGRAKGAKVWEDRLIALADKNEGSAPGVIFGLKNRLPDDWRDKTETEHSGAVKIERIERTVVDPKPPNS
jgi:hypothetical protein